VPYEPALGALWSIVFSDWMIIYSVQFYANITDSVSGCLQLLEILEIYWNLKTLLEILEISLNLMVLLEIFV